MAESIATAVSALVVVLAMAVAFLIPEGNAIVRFSPPARVKSTPESDASAR